MKKRDMTMKAFVAWLRKNRRKTFSHFSCGCPIAEWTGLEVGTNYAYPRNSATHPGIALPPWARAFVAFFDTRCRGIVLGADILREMKL